MPGTNNSSMGLTMTLGQKQEQFSRMLTLLTHYADFLGYGLRRKHLLRCQDCKVGKSNSVHKVGLAQDLVISLNGQITWNDKYYIKFHDFWDMLGGVERINGDLGHFSLEYNGVR